MGKKNYRKRSHIQEQMTRITKNRKQNTWGFPLPHLLGKDAAINFKSIDFNREYISI